MIKKGIFIFACLSLFLWAAGVKATVIENFDSKIAINPDASIQVEETILVDVSGKALHGIYRVLPERYRSGNSYFVLPVGNFSAQDTSGNFYPVKVERDSGNIRFRIGNPNETFLGRREYVLRYYIPGAINYFTDHDELYWNITGDKWDWPIRQVSATIIMPNGVDARSTSLACYQGGAGSKAPCGLANKNTNGNFVEFGATGLGLNEGLTVAVGFPKNFVATIGRLYMPSYDNVMLPLVWGLALLCFVVCFWRWWQYGRDPQTKSIVVAQYEAPKDLSPLQAGYILNESVSPKAMTAEFVWLAVQGFIRIRRLEEKKFWGNSVDYEFEDLGKSTSDLDKNSNNILSQIKGKKFSVIKLEGKGLDHSDNHIAQSFQADTKKLDLYQYFEKSREKAKNIQMVIGSIAMVFALVAWSILEDQGILDDVLVLFGALTGAIITIIFGVLMARRTQEGVEMKKYLEGLKLYMSVAEKDRLAFHNAPEKTPEHFDALLPWAILMGVEKQWIKQFEGIYNREPHWYTGYYGAHGFSFDGLGSDLSSFSSSLNSGFSSGSSGLGGGGSSGGGGGGGGGGGW